MPQNERRRCALAGLAAALFGAAVLYRFPPDRYSFYPRCPIHEFTGLLCPGCGGTRALAALLHGHLAQALHWNALVILLLPVLLAYLVAGAVRVDRHQPFAWPTPAKGCLAVLFATTALFTIWRNL